QPAGEILPTHTRGSAAIEGRSGRVGADRGGHGERARVVVGKEVVMAWWRRLKALKRNMFRRNAIEADLEAEISSYRQMLEDEKIVAGMNPAKARREALMEMEGAEQVKEAVRDARTGASMDTIGAELRQSLR